MTDSYTNGWMGSGLALWMHSYGALLLLIALWSLFWKGLALWHSGRRGQAWWFVILLVVNTVGILDIIYLFAVRRLKPEDLFSKK